MVAKPKLAGFLENLAFVSFAKANREGKGSSELKLVERFGIAKDTLCHSGKVFGDFSDSFTNLFCSTT